jgi:hypothetical protein
MSIYKLKWSVFLVCLIFSCKQSTEPDKYVVELDARLGRDNTGYYHLTLDRTRPQIPLPNGVTKF